MRLLKAAAVLSDPYVSQDRPGAVRAVEHAHFDLAPADARVRPASTMGT